MFHKLNLLMADVSRRIRPLAGGLLILACLCISTVHAQAPAVTHVVPAGIAPGKTTDVTLYGSNLAGITGVWTSLPGKAELAPGIKNNGKDKAKVTYRITLPSDAQVGVGGIRIATGKGISNLRLLLIDDLPSASDNGKNKTLASAQELKLPAAVDGSCEAASFDFYKFTVKAGQRVAVDAYAKRLGSALDPVIRLMDASGRTLESSDDEGGIGADCRLSHTFKTAGTYFIEIHDIGYKGGASHRYRMRVGDFPLLATAFPLAVKKGTKAKLQFAGPSAAGAKPMDVTMPSGSLGSLSIAAKSSAGQGSAPIIVLASDVDEIVETEPNDKLEPAKSIPLPAGLNGRLDRAGDQDSFRFDAKKGQRFVFRSFTRTLGSPAMLSLRVVNAKGGMIVEADDPIVSEVSLSFTAPADGAYYLIVREWQGSHGPAYSYRIDARPYETGFSLSADSDRLNVPQGGVFVVKVTAARRGFTGPIPLELKGLPKGWKITGNTIPAKKNDTVVRVTSPGNLPPGKLYTLSIVGKAKVGDKEQTAVATTLVSLRKSIPGLDYPPYHLLTVLGLGTAPQFPDFFQLAAKPIEFPRLIGQTSFKVTAKRLNKFPDAISLVVEGLPKGFKAKIAPIAKGKGDATITLTGPADLPEGDHKITIKGTATFQNQSKTVVLAGVTLKVVKPLGVSIASPITIAPGKKKKVKITVKRYGEKGEITLVLKNLPKGVTAPGQIKIASGKNDVEIELSAAAKAAPAKAANVTVVAKTKIKGKDISVNSPPAIVELKKS